VIEGVTVGVTLGVTVGVTVGVIVGVIVGVAVGVAVAVGVTVAVGVAVAVAVAVGVPVGVGVAPATLAASGVGGDWEYVLVLRGPPEPFGIRWFETVVAVIDAFSSTCGWPGFRRTKSPGSSASEVS